jgi:hypothetical protein
VKDRTCIHDPVPPDELVTGIASMLANRHAWRALRNLVARCYEDHRDGSCPRFDEALDEAAMERARNVVAWLATEYEIRKR